MGQGQPPFKDDYIYIVLAAERFSNCDTSHVRAEIEKKRIWLRDNEPEEYARAVGEDRNIFDLWIEKGYIEKKLLIDPKN